MSDISFYRPPRHGAAAPAHFRFASIAADIAALCKSLHFSNSAVERVAAASSARGNIARFTIAIAGVGPSRPGPPPAEADLYLPHPGRRVRHYGPGAATAESAARSSQSSSWDNA
ncbi:hypothetical protein EVAR_55367_1 [Eumeta japonica]|uniref:Uncharacterized protein n=1 Tax=Eumeta variegata TaxID=151549 RepID=A0A4C1YXD0_EUMVA|nr:hypothetical protein EVAR_55367_1 [Eumeta japonica]